MVERVRYDRDLSILGNTALKDMVQAGIKNLNDVINMSDDEMRELFVKNKLSLLKALSLRRDIELGKIELVYGVDEKKKLLYDSTTIHDITLSRRSFNALFRAGITHVKLINNMTLNEIIQIKDIGFKSAMELFDLRNQYNAAMDDIDIGVVNDSIKDLYADISSRIFVEPEEFIEEFNKTDKKTDYDSIYNNEYIMECMKKPILILLKNRYSGYSTGKLAEKMPEGFQNTAYVEKVVNKLVDDNKAVIEDSRVSYKWVYFSTCVESLDGLKNKEIIQRRLEGKTLQEVGDSVGLTRERVRQILHKTSIEMNKLFGHFKDEEYKKLILEYEINEARFKDVFNRPDIFIYINGRYYKNKVTKPLNLAIYDEEIDVEIRESLEKYFDSIVPEIDKRRAQQEEALKSFKGKEIGIRAYKKKLMELDTENEFEWGLKENRALIESAKRVGNVLASSSERLRYYDFESYDYTELLKELKIDREEKTVISCIKLFKDNPKLMAKYDLNNGDQLYSLIRKLCENNIEKFNLNFIRMPNIGFNGATIEGVIEEVIRKNKGIKAEKVYDILRLNNGIPNYVTYSRITSFKKYQMYNGTFNCDIRKNTDKEIKEIKNLLVNDFYSADEVEKMLGELEPKGMRSLSIEELERIGYLGYYQYIIKKEHKSIYEYSRKLIKERGTITIKSFSDIFKKVGYHNIRGALLNEYHAILEGDKLIAIDSYSGKISRDSMLDFIEKVREQAKKYEYFNLHLLRKNGFKHEILEENREDAWYDDAISQSRGVYELDFHNVKMLSFEKSYNFQLVEFLKEQVGDEPTYIKIIEYVDKWYGKTSAV